MNQKVRHLRVCPDRDGQRLDNLLMAELRAVPRSLVYRLIRKGQVRVNGARAKPRQRLSAGDEVRIPPVRTGPEARPVRFSDAQLASLRERIIHEDEAYLVVDKPAGMAVHAGSGLPWGLIDLLRAGRPGDRMLELVHRLDRETSGCLLLARTRPALLAAQAGLRDPAAEKRYLCLLSGDPGEAPFTVAAPLARRPGGGGERQVIVDPGKGRPAVSHFRRLERYGGWSLAEVRIETGRTHQIRVHAAHVGHAVAGDPRYGEGAGPPGLRRLFLHCTLLALPVGSEGTVLTASAPLPEGLRAVLDAL